MRRKKIPIKNILLGRPLASKELSGEKLSHFWGVPIMASDAVSSVAYALEEILLVLVPMLGLAAIHYLGFVTIPIILLLLILVVSYSQIIDKYPSGGGAYVVASETLGKNTALIAAAALIIDYILTVAVSISSATAAFLAAFPQFSSYNTTIALICLCVITGINLRGISESSKVFGIPTYAFIVTMAILIVTGLLKMATGSLNPISYQAAQVASQKELLNGMLLLLLLRAFSSGCSALTGVEAVSNAVPIFRNPAQKTAKKVLFTLAGVIIFIFGGTVLLASGLKVIPVPGTTVVAQMGMAVFGEGIFYYILQFATTLILLLAANTAYNGLPTLLAILSKDEFLPRQFAQRGSRLSFSNGIMFIFFTAGPLLMIYDADTHHLIPLYSVGVFLSFTISQLGMVVRWLKFKGKNWRSKLLINLIGAVATAVSAVIVFCTKFSQGAWIVAVAIAVIALIMNNMHKHFLFIAKQIHIGDFKKYYHKSVSASKKLCIVLVSSISRSTIKSLNFANAMSSNVIALHVSTDSERAERFEEEWQDLEIDIPLKIIEAPYRDIVTPLDDYIGTLEETLNPGEDISVLMIKFVEEHWYDNILHNQTTYSIERALRNHKNIATVIVPFIYRL